MRSGLRLVVLAAFLLVSLKLHSEDGRQAWLRYAPLSVPEAKQYETFPSNLVVLGDSVLLKSAQQELTRGAEGMLGKRLASSNAVPSDGAAVVLGTVQSVHAAIPDLQLPTLHEDGYWL